MATLLCFFKTEFPRSPDFLFAPKVTWHSGTRLYNLTPWNHNNAVKQVWILSTHTLIRVYTLVSNTINAVDH